jgi:hypothetical protein
MPAKSRFLIALAFLALLAAPAAAERPSEPKPQADLIVTGQVGKVYTNIDPDNVNFVVEIAVRAVEKGQGIPSGQILDARCFQRRPEAPRIPAAYGHHQVPREGESIRAYLMRRPAGRYEGTYPDWIDPLGPGPPGGRRPGPGPGARYPYWALGVVTQPALVGDRVGLQIVQIVPNSAAQRAGLAIGDVILEANGEPTRSPQDLRQVVSKSGGSLKLTIRNMRTAKRVTIEVALDPR